MQIIARVQELHLLLCCIRTYGGPTTKKQFFPLIVCGAILAGCASSPIPPVAPSPLGVTRIPETEPEETVPSPETNFTTPGIIDLALSRGEITTGQRLLYLTYAVYEPDSLPEEYRSNAPWRGTMVVREIKQFATSAETFCTLALDIQREIRRLIPESVSCTP